jgi:hypothetical protein
MFAIALALWLRNTCRRKEAAMTQLTTRTILIALVVVNAIAIGASEVQRRALVETTIRAQANFEERAGRVGQQQVETLDRLVKQLAVLTDRVNHTEILTLTVPAASDKINEIAERVREMQKTQQDLKQPRSTQ